MIAVTRFNGTKFYLNADLIQTVESTPDTVVTLTNNVKVIIKESPEKVVDRIIAYQQQVHEPRFKSNSGE